MIKLNLMNQVRLKGAIAGLACLFFLAGVANANTIIYDNLDSTYGGYDSLTGWGPPLFDSFAAGSTDTTLLEVQLKLRGSPSPGSLSVALYSDSNRSPGKLLCTIGSLSDKALPSTWSVLDFWLTSPYPLAADTRYWVVLTSINSSTAEWSWTPDQGDLGAAGDFLHLQLSHLLPVLGVAIAGTTAHYCLSNAFRAGDATLVVPLDFMRIPLIAVVGWALYGESLDIFVLLGALIIIGGVLWNLRAETAKAHQNA